MGEHILLWLAHYHQTLSAILCLISARESRRHRAQTIMVATGTGVGIRPSFVSFVGCHRFSILHLLHFFNHSAPTVFFSQNYLNALSCFSELSLGFFVKCDISAEKWVLLSGINGEWENQILLDLMARFIYHRLRIFKSSSSNFGKYKIAFFNRVHRDGDAYPRLFLCFSG